MTVQGGFVSDLDGTQIVGILTHRLILFVGDDGQSKEATSGTLMKESEHVYALWCSGRVCVEGMLVELKLLKRQDLINVMSGLFKPASDQIVSIITYTSFN